MEFIEAPIFSKLIYDYIDDTEYSALQIELASRPDAGDIIPGSSGIHKLRWKLEGRGKRGGLRIIYYWKDKQNKIWLLTLHAKNEAESLPISVLREIRKEVEK